MISSRLLYELRSELKKSLMAKLGLTATAGMLLLAIFAPFVAPYDPTTQQLEQGLLPPLGFTIEQETTQLVDGEMVTSSETVSGSLAHILGTDRHGRDLLSRVVYGARTSATIAIVATTFAALVGMVIGLTAGYFGGKIDDLLMRIADVMLAFPSIILAITLIGTLGPVPITIPDPFVALGIVDGMPGGFVFPVTLTLVIGLVLWVWFARVARGEAISIKEENYIKASKSFGASDSYIIRKHVFPNAFSPILVLATTTIAFVIIIESALSFLGFSGTTLSWGFDIAQGRDQLATSWWNATIPGLAIMISVIGVNLIGDWLRDALDPELEGEGGM